MSKPRYTRTVPGLNGMGSVKIIYKPRKKRGFPYGILLYITGISISIFSFLWSDFWTRNIYLIPACQKILGMLDATRKLLDDENRLDLVYRQESVSIRRDTAQNLDIASNCTSALLFGQGYAHASLNTFQMIYLRLAANGKLSEYFGDAMLPIDRQARLLGLKYLAEQDFADLSLESKELLEAYSQGFNKFLSEKHSTPLELLIFKKAWTTVEKWNPLDTLVILRLVGTFIHVKPNTAVYPIAYCF